MQLAGDAECVRAPGILVLTAGLQYAGFSLISPETAFANGLSTLIAARNMMLGASGANIDIRSWEWFTAYYLGNPTQGVPSVAAQQGQGKYGVMWFSPIPNETYGLFVDGVWLPIPLVDDSTFEAIPYPWTDAVPFYAAWLAMMQLQRQADAHIMLTRYQELALRGRQEVTPTVLPDNMPGGPGAHSAALKTTLTTVPQSAGGRGP